MAWYNGKYSCGHEGRVNIVGPTKDRQWKVDRHFEKMCPACWEKHLKEEREKERAKAAELADEMELPELHGSEKQVAWANTIRVKLIENLDERAKNDNLDGLIDWIIKVKIAANFWIDNRNEIPAVLYKTLWEDYKKSINEEPVPQEVVDETTLEPAECIKPGRVEIVVKDDSVKAFYEKDDDFINIVKRLQFKWTGVWERAISELTGSAEDRAAELGNRLLAAGFRVTIQDPKVREMAINGMFEPECERWIQYNTKKEKLAIRWFDRNEYMYNAARKIPTSSYYSLTGSVLVDISHYEEVIEYAALYGCKISKRAQVEIDRYKNIKYNKVEPVSAEIQDNNVDGLKAILESSREVLEDLKDD